MDKISVQTITLRRAEGPLTDCDHDVTVESWGRANLTLRDWSKTAPANGAYDKCDFKIVFADGSTYSGRYDLEHFSRKTPDLAAHVRDHMNYLAGTPPLWMTRHRDIMAQFLRDLATPERQAQAATARQWLSDYDVGLRA